MSPVLTAAMLVVALAFFAFTMTRRLAPLAALRRENRLDRVGERVRALLAFGFGQKRLVDPEERGPGILHVLIFAAFLVLALRTITMFGMGFSEAFHLPLLGEDAPLGRLYLFVKDLVVLGALVGVAGFLWRRLVTKPDRVTLSTEGVVILFFIAGLMLTDMAFDGGTILASGTAALHLALVAVALLLLPITPSDSWKPAGAGDPTVQIIGLLIVSLGLQYFVLSSTSPLLQQWFSQAHPGVSPFRLYALSNAGSLLALVTFPVYFETHFTRTILARLWGWRDPTLDFYLAPLVCHEAW